MLRHAWPSAFPGAGVVGVVVFFTLSGYLITGLLSRELRGPDGVDFNGSIRAGRAGWCPPSAVPGGGIVAGDALFDPLGDRDKRSDRAGALTWTGNLPFGRPASPAASTGGRSRRRNSSTCCGRRSWCSPSPTGGCGSRSCWSPSPACSRASRRSCGSPRGSCQGSRPSSSHSARRRRQGAGEHMQQRRLAGAGRPDHGELFAGRPSTPRLQGRRRRPRGRMARAHAIQRQLIAAATYLADRRCAPPLRCPCSCPPSRDEAGRTLQVEDLAPFGAVRFSARRPWSACRAARPACRHARSSCSRSTPASCRRRAPATGRPSCRRPACPRPKC